MPTQSTGTAEAASQTSPKASVHVRLAANANLETISHIVKSIGGRYGCTTCGLGGIDLTLSGDPAEANEFAQLAGVQSVSVK